MLSLSTQVDDALKHSEQITALVSKVSSCEYSSAKFTEVLEDIQKLIDKLNLRSYTNLVQWVSQLDAQVTMTTHKWHTSSVTAL